LISSPFVSIGRIIIQAEAMQIDIEETINGKFESMFNKAPATTGAVDPAILEKDDAIPTAVPLHDGVNTSGVYAYITPHIMFWRK
jgi:hypothetical protein